MKDKGINIRKHSLTRTHPSTAKDDTPSPDTSTIVLITTRKKKTYMNREIPILVEAEFTKEN